MDIKELSKEQLIQLAKLRLFNEGKEYFTELILEDSGFKYFNGVSFIVKSNKWADWIFNFSFRMFYPNEFMYLLSIGVKF